MHRALIAFIALLVAAVAEAYLLARIVGHAAGSSYAEAGALVPLLLWAAAPLVGAAVVVALHQRRALAVPLAMVGVVCVVGPLLGFVALVQYSHATPGFMVVAFVLQCAAVLRSALGLRPRAT
jgi:hypothetical protein